MGLTLNALPDPQSQVRSLQQELYKRNRELQEAEERADAAEARANAAERKAKAVEAGAAHLRKVLNPLYSALGAVFGEIEAMGIQDVVPSGKGDPIPDRVSAVWENWKKKLGEGPAKIIDALLLHRDMNTQQLAIATGYHRTSIPKMIYQLNRAGLLNKNGGRFSLKEL